jgi:hypothetical protein
MARFFFSIFVLPYSPTVLSGVTTGAEIKIAGVLEYDGCKEAMVPLRRDDEPEAMRVISMLCWLFGLVFVVVVLADDLDVRRKVLKNILLIWRWWFAVSQMEECAVEE